jgi:hypothetical protein
MARSTFRPFFFDHLPAIDALSASFLFIAESPAVSRQRAGHDPPASARIASRGVWLVIGGHPKCRSLHVPLGPESTQASAGLCSCAKSLLGMERQSACSAPTIRLVLPLRLHLR